SPLLTSLCLRYFILPSKRSAALVKPGILRHHFADSGEAEGQQAEGDDDRRLEEIGEDGFPQRRIGLGEETVDEERPPEQGEAQILVADRQQQAIGQDLPPGPPSLPQR